MSRPAEDHRAAVAAVVAGAVAARPAVTIEVAGARGRLAADVTTGVDVPGFDNSQMDGFAVRSTDLADGPVTLTTVAHVVAGQDAPAPLPAGTAAPIMTGAAIPAGADAVVPVELTRPGGFGPVGGGAAIGFDSPVEAGTFIRRRGADARAGEVLLPAGTPVTPGAIAALTAGGIASVEVTAPLRLGIVGTGTEIAAGLVPDSNAAALLAHAHELGLPARAVTVADDTDAFATALDGLTADCDLIVTTGGVSAGTREVVRQVLEPTPGAWFGHVAVQPGGPQGLARWGSLPVVCLPGNPVSTLVSFELFLRPPLAEAAGVVAARPAGTAELAEPLTSPAGKLQVRRGRFDDDGRIRLEGGPGSHLVVSYARADVLVMVPEDVTGLDAGDTVRWWRIA